MGGGLLQLVAYGAQDVYLTGNPQITFFKVAYRRHTNFALEAIEQTFNGTSAFGSRVTCQITRNGDLINRIYFVGTLTNENTKTEAEAAKFSGGLALVPYFGLKLLKTIELEIGGQRIDKHYSEWLYIWNELSLPAGKRDGYKLMVGGDKYNRSILLEAKQSYSLYVPLEFWFCRNVGLALPLIALQYHEVKINIEFESLSNMVDKQKNYSDRAFIAKDNAATPALLSLENAINTNANGDTSKLTLTTAALWVDYIFLDTDERRRFAQLSHEYLIEQLQFTGQEAVTSDVGQKTKLNFNHPCKELIWFVSNDYTTNKNKSWFNFTTKADIGDTALATNSAIVKAVAQTNYNYLPEILEPSNPIKSAKLVLNGNDRFYERPGRYFNLVQPYQHHENIPTNAGINVYSFALKPEEHQPSGTLNMSRIDTAVLNLSFEAKTGNGLGVNYNPTLSTLHVYAVNYNVLRILSGMGGLAYSN